VRFAAQGLFPETRATSMKLRLEARLRKNFQDRALLPDRRRQFFIKGNKPGVGQDTSPKSGSTTRSDFAKHLLASGCCGRNSPGRQSAFVDAGWTDLHEGVGVRKGSRLGVTTTITSSAAMVK